MENRDNDTILGCTIILKKRLLLQLLQASNNWKCWRLI